MRTFLSVAAGTLLIACNAATMRPRFSPLGAALIDTIFAPREVATRAIADRTDSAGVATRTFSLIDGFLETVPFDLATERSGRGSPSHPETSVILRFWVDPLPGDRSRVTAEAAFRTRVDPSLDPRTAETMAPPDHEGYLLLRRILDEAKSSVVAQ